MLKTPVAFIIFNRPDLTQIVFNAIRQAKPQQLFVIADGPRFPEEWAKCQQARDIIKQVDWDCQVYTRFLDKNIGGPYCCSSGISWVFSQVEKAIILEDDCLPNLSFFNFCEEILLYYIKNTNIMQVTGNNFQRGQNRTEYSYYFSLYPCCWGWATWRRAWEKFDLNLNTWQEAKQAKFLEKICYSPEEVKHWTYTFERVFNKESVHWDYAWKYACFYHQGLTATPNVNLVSNIGFRNDATHTKNIYSSLANLPTIEIFEIEHPPTIHINKEADLFAFDFRFRPDVSHLNNLTLLTMIKSKVKQTIRILKSKFPEKFRKKYSQKYRNFKSNIKNISGKIIRQFKRPPFPALDNKEVYLHLGCGPVNHPSFINIDGIAYPHIHYIRAIDNLKPFAPESVDLIYASHCLEHFSFRKVPKVLSEWYRILKKEGTLRISVPDFELLLKIYNENNQDIETIIQPLMGGQDYKYNFHMTVFNQKNLDKLLKNTGFRNVQIWIPGTSPTTTFNDWSCRSIIVRGKLYPVSLNIEAIK